MRDVRDIKRQNYEVAKAQCEELGVELSDWAGDEEWSASPPALTEPEPQPAALVRPSARPRLVLLQGGGSVPAQPAAAVPEVRQLPTKSRR